MPQKSKFTAKRLLNNAKSYFSKPANIITVVFLVLLLAGVVFPLFTLLIGTFKVNTPSESIWVGQPINSWTGNHWSELLADPDDSLQTFWTPLYRSVLMALLSCVVAVVGGGVVAWFITRSNLPGKKFISLVFVFPYIMPSWSIAMFWENFFKNTNSCMNQMGLLQSLTGIAVPDWMVHGLFPCAMSLGIHYAPFAYILIGGILRNMDANLEEAATVLKAGRSKILFKITLPIVLPALISTVLLVFSSSISSYTVPFMIGQGDQDNFLSISILMKNYISASGGIRQGQGYVIAVILMLFSIGILTLNNWFTGKRKSFTTVTGKSGQVSLVNLGKAKIPVAVILIIVIAFFSIIPMVTFALESLWEVPGDWSSISLNYWLSGEMVEGSTKGDTIGILRSATMWGALGRSVGLSIIVAFVAGTFGILIGYAVSHKRGSKAATLVSNLAFIPYLIPAMSFGVVYLALAYTPGFTWLNGTFFILILVGSIKFMPFASRTGTSAMLQLSGEIEEAAIMMNVPWWKRMTRVLFPIQKSSFISGYLLPFISCMRELTLFVLLTQNHETLITTLMGEYTRTGLTQVSNAINLLIIVVVLVIQFTVNKLTGASIDKGVGGN